jgi:cytochrome P450
MDAKNLLFVPSEDATSLGRRLAAAAKEQPMVLEAGIGLPMLLRTAHITAAARDTESFTTRMFASGILKGGLASLQGEEHTKMRRIYNLFFTPRAVARYEESITRPVANEVTRHLEGKERADLLDEFAVEMPKRVISTLFGLPLDKLNENDARIRAMFRGIIQLNNPIAAAEGEKAYRETLEEFAVIIEREMKEPSPTLLGEIIRILQGEGMATLETVQQVVLTLLLGGYETTIRLFANALYALLAHPEALGRIQQDPKLIVPAIEESMRWCPSNVGMIRLVEKKVSMPDLELEPGTVCYLAAAAGHYDETAYPSPEVFDIDRKVTPAIFGGGPHFCVGAPLARMEARVGLSTLIQRLPRMRLDPSAKPVFTYGVRESVAYGPDKLPVLLQ